MVVFQLSFGSLLLWFGIEDWLPPALPLPLLTFARALTAVIHASDIYAPGANQPLMWCGVFFVEASIALLWWTHTTLGWSWNPFVSFIDKDASKLITSGPYRLVRHPMYLAVVVLSIGVMIATSNLLLAISFILFSVAASQRIGLEESILSDAFSDDWHRFVQNTRWKLIPFVY